MEMNGKRCDFLLSNQLIIIRGGGDLATGVIQKFWRSGFPLLVLETHAPTAIRRTVALSEAMYDGETQVEDVRCIKISSIGEIEDCHRKGAVPILSDPTGDSIEALKPIGVVDAILAKRNLGTQIDMAPITIGLGPGFCAGVDVHAVIETMRGHDLGRLILTGEAIPNTGIPGELGGKGAQRVIHALASGTMKHHTKIGDVVAEGAPLFSIGDTTALAPFTGLLRGLIREDMLVHKGMKVADIDPRIDVNYHTISDKARALGGATLEAYLYLNQLYKVGR